MPVGKAPKHCFCVLIDNIGFDSLCFDRKAATLFLLRVLFVRLALLFYFIVLVSVSFHIGKFQRQDVLTSFE